jgi:predicted component of type VI protein secretion system
MTGNVVLAVENEDGANEVITFDQCATLLVGRSPECSWRSRSQVVSRRHCLFDIEPPFVSVRDLGSLNGTYVNGQRIEGAYDLADGDVVQIGPMKWELRADPWMDAEQDRENAEPAFVSRGESGRAIFRE